MSQLANLATRRVSVGLVNGVVLTMKALVRRTGAHEAGYHMNTQHLQGLSTVLTSKLDLVLTARDGRKQIAFPVHQIIVAQHSLVLSDMLEHIEDLPWGDKYFSALSQTLPYIPVNEECSPSAISAALAFMYKPLPETADVKTRQTVADPDFDVLALHEVPAAASQVDFADMYGMRELRIAQEASLVEALEDELDNFDLGDTKVDQAVDCAVAADNSNLGALLCMCEAVVIANDYIHDH